MNERPLTTGFLADYSKIAPEGLFIFMKSPAHYQEYIKKIKLGIISDKHDPETEGIKRAIFSPDLPIVNEHNKAGHQRQLTIRNIVKGHSKLQELLSGDKGVSPILKWENTYSKALCKAQPHWYNPDTETIFHVFITDNAHSGTIKKQLLDHRIDMRIALETEILCMRGYPFDHCIIAIESNAPYAMQLYRFNNEILNKARQRCNYYLQQYQECILADEWPAYPEEVYDIQ